MCHIQSHYYQIPSYSHTVKFSGTWLNMVPTLLLLTMMLNCPLILLNQMRWKTCFSRISMLKVRHLDVLLTPAKGSDDKHLLEFHIGWMRIFFFWGGVNLIWLFQFSCWYICSVNIREWCLCKFLENSLLRRICEFKKKEVDGKWSKFSCQCCSADITGMYMSGRMPEHTQCARRSWYKV